MLRGLPAVLVGFIGSLVLLGCGDSGTQPSDTPSVRGTVQVEGADSSEAQPSGTPSVRGEVQVEDADSNRAQTSGPPPEEYVERGEYEVGVRTLYFHDPDRPFDAWNSRHASDRYRKTLEEINAGGEKQIVTAHVWYPADAGGPARRPTVDEFWDSASEVFRSASGPSAQYYAASLRSGEAGTAGSLSALSDEVWKRLVDSLYQAPVADGEFPVIIAAHGLGGHSLAWSPFAQYLASRGYVVVAPNFISDGSLPNVLDSPDSVYARAASAGEVDGVYRTILGESKVIPGFYKYFFGQQSQESLRVLPDGARRVGEMMGEFFTQRVDDVETIIDGLESLNKGGEACAAEYSARGQPIHGADVCGLFVGSLDVGSIGVMGHSLGSMTAQFAVARSDRVAAAVGYNNGPPRYWEPKGIFGEGVSEDGQPAGNPNPVMQIHGSEDAFVQNVFRGLMWNTFSAAGGDPEDIWVLEEERALPTDENPQPIARNAYNRATGDKVIISVKNLNHDSLIQDFPSLVSERMPIVVDGKEYTSDYWRAPAQKKAVGRDVLDSTFRGESYTPLAWDVIGDYEAYMPTFIRNYYTKNWFDYYLKGEDGGRRFTENPIEDKGILDIRYDLPGS